MTKQKKILFSIAAVALVVALIFLMLFLTKPKTPGNQYFTVIENFTATKHSEQWTHGYYEVKGQVQNKTDSTLNVTVTINVKNSFNYAESKTFAVTLTANEIKTINNITENQRIDAFANTIKSIKLEVDGKSFTYSIDGGGDVFDNIFENIFGFMIIPFILVFIIMIVFAFVTKAKTYGFFSSRLSNVDIKIQAATQNANHSELEKLKREKAEIELQLAKFVTCEYCGTKNLRNSVKCSGCGANIK